MNEIEKNVETARIKFSKAIKEYRQTYGQYIDFAPTIDQSALTNCKVFSNRLEMLGSDLFGKYGVWAEIGVDQAIFSRNIYEKISPVKLHLIDIDTARIVWDNIDKQVKSGVIEVHAGDSSSVINSFPDCYFDGIYIDGDHYYDGVKRDILSSVSKLKPGGFLIFNDYTAWSPGSMSKCGVARAVNEFINKEGWRVYALALQGSGYYDIAIKKP
jgi:hypothetical protein